MTDLVLSSFLRIATHSRIFDPPSPLDTALTFATQVRDRPNRVAIAPGARHWDIFTRLCRQVQCKGNLVQDAYLAALAIESGSEWITTDPRLQSLSRPALASSTRLDAPHQTRS